MVYYISPSHSKLHINFTWLPSVLHNKKNLMEHCLFFEDFKILHPQKFGQAPCLYYWW